MPMQCPNCLGSGTVKTWQEVCAEKGETPEETVRLEDARKRAGEVSEFMEEKRLAKLEETRSGYVRLICPTYKHMPHALLPTGYKFCAICGAELIQHPEGWPPTKHMKYPTVQLDDGSVFFFGRSC